MSTNIIIPPTIPLYDSFQKLATQQRLVFFAGLPGVGKSLLLQQLALMAHEKGRLVHLLQWDVTRAPFETPEILARYPELDGVTHAAIRKAVGLWARVGVMQWHAAYPEAQHMLIGEVPLIGNRLIELVQQRDDQIESLLASAQTTFLIPIPSRAVRQTIEATRKRTIAKPQHERESADAPPNVLQALWQALYRLAHQLGMVDSLTDKPLPYNPDIYAGVYQHLLQHRHAEPLLIDSLLPASGSVYELNVVASELIATPDAVADIMAQIQRDYSPATASALTP
jgi:hypothetical protein